MIIAGTGHRPNKILVGTQTVYKSEAYAVLIDFAERCLRKLTPDLVISGMALGWDQALAQAAIACRIPFDAYIPFVGQESRWPVGSQFVYSMILEHARNTVICSEGGYAVWKMQYRNEVMVDDADCILALWNGTAGGTANCVKYAEEIGRKVHNVWDAWTRHAERALV